MHNPRNLTNLTNSTNSTNSINFKEFSKLGIFSEFTANVINGHGQQKTLTLDNGRKIVEDVVSAMFNERLDDATMAHLSSSQCSIGGAFKGSEHMDKRLKCWQDTLRDRAKMQQRIYKKTGRRPDEMLFNLPITVDQREKGTIQRLMDYATRLKLANLEARTPGVLPEINDECQCVCVPEVRETLPKVEQTGMANLEITGLSNATNNEIFGQNLKREKENARERNKWANSQALGEGISTKAKEIKKILEYYPDMDELEVVGENVNTVNKKIKGLERISLVTVSSTTSESYISDGEEEEDEETMLPTEAEIFEVVPEPPVISVGLKINNTVYLMDRRQSPWKQKQDVSFKTFPYQIQFKEVMCLENIGRRPLFMEWQPVSIPMRNSQLGNDCYNSFIFNYERICLLPGEIHIVKVLYQPNKLEKCKQEWEMKVYPNPFCSRLLVQLRGISVPWPEYQSIIRNRQQTVIQKSHKQCMDKLIKLQADLVPTIQPHEQLCPYDRTFDEREVFNLENPGYNCKRFDDIEIMRAMYNALKMPREPPWNFSLDSLKAVIMRQKSPEMRMMYFNGLLRLLEPMTSRREDESLQQNTERDRTRLIYVRGCIGNGIEEWEDLMCSLEQSCLKSELILFYAHKTDSSSDNESESNGSDSDGENPWLRRLKHEQPEAYVLRKLRAKKYYRDSLYMLTYTQLCDMAENIVSVIESTECI